MPGDQQCVICGQPAYHHETWLTGGTVETRAYCAAHGAARLPHIPVDPAAFTSMQQAYQAMSESDRARLAAWSRAERRRRPV
jgi:hypothetical protein